MKQLSAADSQMLFIESPEAPNHVTPISIYDPSTAPGGKVTYKGILANLEARLHLAPSFRRKLMRVPLDIDEPYWVDDPNFDLEYHVRHLALPKPGDWRQFCIQAARLIARPLDPSRPLWEMNIIEGLDNIEGLPPGCFAIVMKIHHSMIDGKAGVELINALHDLEPEPKQSKPAVTMEPWQPEPQPSPWKLAGVGLRRMILKPGHMLRVTARTMPGLLTNTRKTKVPFRVPKTPLNKPLTSPRVYDARFYDLGEFKRMRELVPGATINDLAIAIISGAMRKYLMTKKSLPDDSLIASVPISIRTKDSASQSEGNELIVQNIPICSNIADPRERLEAICDVMGDTKSYVQAVGAKKLADISTALPGRVSGLMASAMSLVADMSGEAMMSNTVITNVPGVQVPLYMTGAKAVLMCGGGPLSGTIGLIHLVGSYCGKMHLNITACRDLLPDPAFYMECLDASFKEFQDARMAISETTVKSATKAGSTETPREKRAAARTKPKASPRKAAPRKAPPRASTAKASRAEPQAR